MKYLFSVKNLNDKTRKVYSVEADNENNAKKTLITKFFPYFPEVTFDTVVGPLNDSFKRVITSLGSVEEIGKL